MLTNETVSKLQDMRLGTMARQFKQQLDDPIVRNLSFEDRFGLLVDAEWATRKSNHMARLIKNASYAIPSACMEDIEYLPSESWIRHSSCGWPYAPTYRNPTMSFFWEPPEQARHIWPARSVWRPAETSILSATSVCRICWWKSPLPGVRAPTGNI